MAKFSRDIHKKAAKIYDSFGDQEYDIQAVRDQVESMLRADETAGKSVFAEAARSIVQRLEKSNAKASEGFLPLDEHIALGERRRIKRRKMTVLQALRRQSVIQKNKQAQDEAFNRENSALLEFVTECGADQSLTWQDIFPDLQQDAAD